MSGVSVIDICYIIRPSTERRDLWIVTRSEIHPNSTGPRGVSEGEMLAMGADGPHWIKTRKDMHIQEEVTGWHDPKLAASLLVAALTKTT